MRNAHAKLEIRPAGGPVKVGAALQLNLFAHDARGGTDLVMANQATWTSADPRLGEVSRQGRLTPRKPGTLTITASYGALVARAVFTIEA